MDHGQGSRILRLEWLEKQAEAHYEIAWRKGDSARMVRANRLQAAAHNEALAILKSEAAPYNRH
jgi:hypothetical protein